MKLDGKYQCRRDGWKDKEFDGFSPSEIDFAMMSAFIDGEGSILINPVSGTAKSGRKTESWYLKISISNTDVRLMKWLQDRFGGSVHFSWQTKKSKKCFHWYTPSFRAAWILHNCLQFLVIKRQQAEIAITLQETMGSYKRGKGITVPTEVTEKRRDLKDKLLILKKKGINGYTEYNSLEAVNG